MEQGLLPKMHGPMENTDTGTNADENADAALWRLMESYGDLLLRMCFLSLRDITLAEDAVQDTFLKAYQHWESFRGESGEKTWLCKIAINTCRDYRRRNWWKMRARQIAWDAVPEPATQAEVTDDMVIRVVMNLPGKEKEMVLLRYYQGMKLTEIAKELALPEGTVASRLNRARKRLHKELKGWYFDE